jgi:hypothetical protein
MQCEVLWDTIYFPLVAPTANDLTIIVPLTIINDSVRTAVIRDLAIKVEETGRSETLYMVGATVRTEDVFSVEILQLIRNIDTSVEFAVSKGEVVRRDLVFVPTRRTGEPISWDRGTYNCKLYVQFADRESPTLIKEQTFNPKRSVREAMNISQSVVTIRADRPLASLL